jgi:hypothetical protein
MAVAFELPPTAKGVFSEIATMPADQYAKLSKYLSELPQDTILSSTIDKLQSRLPTKYRAVFWNAIHEVARLARTAETNGYSEEQTADIVVSQVGLDESQRLILKERLEALLREKSLQLHARAWSLLYDEERCMTGCRLVTDIRPIFNEAGTEADHFIIVNQLHIMYLANQERRNAFFALDEDDIEALSALANRAKRKIAFLRKIIPSVVAQEGKPK